MDDPGLAEKLVDALVLPDGSPGLRRVHAFGVGATGYFVASDVARDFCVAEHLQGKRIDVVVRFSNGSGSSVQRDGWSDVRGMATRFRLAPDAATDLIAMTLPEFFTPTPETFLSFSAAARPAPVTRESPWQKILDMLRLTQPLPDPYPGQTVSPNAGAIQFADQNGYAQVAVFHAASIGAPVSYARATYHAVHTFVVLRARWRAPLGSLLLATRRRCSQHRSRCDAGRQISATGTAPTSRRGTRALLADDVGWRNRRRSQRPLAPMASASAVGW